MRRAPLGFCLLSMACGPHLAPMTELPPRPDRPVAGPSAGSAAVDSAATMASAPSAVPPPAPIEPAAAVSPSAPSPPALVVIEPVYSALGHGRLATEMLTLARDEELFQWALGGSADPAHPANRAGYHPATRVVVDVELLSRAPKGSTKRLLRIARSTGYWGFRSCFEAAQRLNSKSERATKVRLTLSASGRVLGSRTVGNPAERDYARCVLERARALDFTPGFTRKLDIELSVKQWPGHAPVPPRAPDGTVQPKLSDADRQALEALVPTMAVCYEKGLSSDAKLWGRLAFKLTVAASRAIEQAVEVETHFPNAETIECARQALLGARLEVSPGELTLAIRFGQPPAPPAPPAPASEPAPPEPAPPSPVPVH